LRRLKRDYHKSPHRLRIPIKDKKQIVGFLRPISQDLGDERDKYIDLLARWREENWRAYPTVFKVTKHGTEKWVQDQLIDREDRILFMVIDLENQVIGHVGLSNFDFSKRSAEIDNVVRGLPDRSPGIMTLALNALVEWSHSALGLRGLNLRVFLDNRRAIKLYERCGFKGVRTIPLHKVITDDLTSYEEIPEGKELSVDRVFLLMDSGPL